MNFRNVLLLSTASFYKLSISNRSELQYTLIKVIKFDSRYKIIFCHTATFREASILWQKITCLLDIKRCLASR